MTLFRNSYKLLLGGILLGLLVVVSCKKQGVTIPPATATFTSQTGGTYFVENDPNTVYKVPVSLTNVSDIDRQVNFTITSPTGATAGTQYTVSGSSVTIPAKGAIAYIEIKGIYAQYSAGRKDTLVITLENPDANMQSFNGVYKLLVRGPCFDGAVDQDALDGLLGDYSNTNDDGFGPWGPYTTTVKSITPLTTTTARVVITNVWDDGFGDVNFIMDWTDPNNTVINLDGAQVVPADAGILNSAYNGMNLVIANHPSPGNASNKFSVCTGTINLRYRLGVYNPATSTVLGYFPTVVTTIMKR